MLIQLSLQLLEIPLLQDNKNRFSFHTNAISRFDSSYQ
jgi:hypothetical protein